MAILGLIQAGAGAYSAFSGFRNQRRTEKMLSRQLPAEQRAAEIAAILRDPNASPLFKAQMADEFASLMEPMQQNITMQKLADRRAMLRGQPPSFFNPERADETIDYMTSRGSQNIMSQARQNVLARLLSSAQEYKDIGRNDRERLQGYATRQADQFNLGKDLFQQYAPQAQKELEGLFGIGGVGTRQGSTQYGPPSQLFSDYLRRANQARMTKVY